MSQMCFNCFQPLPEGAVVCPSCGYDPRKTQGKYPLALPAGTVLNGQYILGRVLGQGGFGITYVAQDHKTKELVAVKEYFPDTMATRSQGYTVTAYTGQREENFTYGKECFLGEAKTLAEFIGNRNIVRVYSYFEENNTAYFVMEYVRGRSFQDYLKEHGRIPWEEAERILFPVMDALGAVHAKGIVHRDVTPDNIYLTDEGTVKLLDFGAARYSLGDRSRSLDVVLKHGFAPKEQYSRHGRQGPFTDVYALGATFYYAITGRIPPDSIDRQEEDELILPSSLGVRIPPEVEDALCKALAVSAMDRFQSMGEFQSALRNGEMEEPVPQPPVGEIVPPSRSESPGGTEPIAPTIPVSREEKPNDVLIQPVEPGKDGPVSAGKGVKTIVGKAQTFLKAQVERFRSWLNRMELEKRKKVLLGGGAASVVLLVGLIALIVHWVPEKSYSLEDIPVAMTMQRTYSEVVDGTGGLIAQVEECDTEGNVLKASGYDESGALIYWFEYEYDDEGNNVRETRYEPDGSWVWKYERRYDSAGNMVKETYRNEEGEKIHTNTSMMPVETW